MQQWSLAVGLVLVAAARGAVGTRVTSKVRTDFDHLRQSVVRIQAVSLSFDWLHPFIPGQDQVGLGSGFVVQSDPYPLFVTNAHVINDAKQVTLQLLLFGEKHWDAEVVSACSKFDLALLVLKEPEVFTKALASHDITLKPLPLSEQVAAMGEDVVALGFPLGQNALKISKGNIAGNEAVNGNICIQSTAPISPGSSGGPLLDSGAKAVVGVNFAKSTQGENINYVIPAWRVRQVVRKHLHDQPFAVAGAWKRLNVQVPEHELTTAESNRALYALSNGCSAGVYIARVGERSFFRKARPPLPAGSFLMSVNGQVVDSFGGGLNTAYAADRVAFYDLFFMVPDLSGDVEFRTCFRGNVTEHKVSMAWAPQYESGIRYVDEPHLAGSAGDFEMFGDISVMQMTVNVINSVLTSTGDPGPARWLHPDYAASPRLIVNFVRSGSYAADVLPVGSAVSKVNGREVRTLAEFREQLMPQNGTGVWTLETDTGRLAALMFKESLAEQLLRAQAPNARYLLTPGVALAAQRFGLAEGSPVGFAKHPMLLAEAVPEPDSVGSAGAEARAAGPLTARRLSQGGPLSTRADRGLVWGA